MSSSVKSLTKRKTKTTAKIKMMMMTTKTTTAIRSECALIGIGSTDFETTCTTVLDSRVISLIWRKRHGVRAHDELALADGENENRVETLRCRGRGKISRHTLRPKTSTPKSTIDLFSFRGSMGVNPL